MSTRKANPSRHDPIAVRCREILDQMTTQVVSQCQQAMDPERLAKLSTDLKRLVHLALNKHGNVDIVASIHDCFLRCQVDIDDTSVLRRARGVVKGELKKAGIDTVVPGLDPALDAETIILTTKRTVAGLTTGKRASGSSSSSMPGPALDPKPSAPAPAPAPAPAKPAAALPRIHKPIPAKVATPAAAPRRTASSTVLPKGKSVNGAFDLITTQAMAQIEKSGHKIARADYLALVYNDEKKKMQWLERISAELEGMMDQHELARAVDELFRGGFKDSYIERTDRQGLRRAHKR